MAVDLFGGRLVSFRLTNGTPVVMDARCWHMGADLAQGSIAGDQIVCPFHGWQYAASGNCVHIPGQSEIPRCARQRTYCAHEFAGRVFAFLGPQSDYPLPFFLDTDPADLTAAPSFEFIIHCPWWLVGTNGFDLQHFAGPHHRRLVGQPIIDSPHPAARRILATFEVCGANWRDRLSRRFAGRYVSMDVTVWSGTLVFVIARFHTSVNSGSAHVRATTYGMTEIRPVSSAPDKQSLVRVTIFCLRRSGPSVSDWLAVRMKGNFVRAFLKPDTLLLHNAHYHPTHLIDADRQMIEYLRWLAMASSNHPIPEEPTCCREL